MQIVVHLVRALDPACTPFPLPSMDLFATVEAFGMRSGSYLVQEPTQRQGAPLAELRDRIDEAGDIAQSRRKRLAK